MRRQLPLLCLLVLACKGESAPVTATQWPEADALFQSDVRWLGADGAYSVDLRGDRTLWLFGDTFVAADASRSRDHARFLRNSIGLQTGRDPSRALMAFYWGADDGGNPQSWLAQDGADWFWPGGGARMGDTLVLFYGRVHTPAGDPSGFEGIGWRAVVVSNPDADPSSWQVTDAALPADSHGLQLGTAVLVADDHLVAYGQQGLLHSTSLARWTVSAATAGDLSSPEWWCGDAWRSACDGDPAVILSAAAPEFSVQPGGRLAPYVMVESEGYGATTLALRTAPAPEGPWSDPQSFFRPPESLEEGAFVYAGKAHPGLQGADLVATYVPGDLYFPRFVRIGYR